ncbi:hypothetical protein BQ8794_240247 [Mesorhizobium prunaredense]|uniref:Uncharacterized protein n=1 Tax=Mesorhizobium prunaredense TaxID=1631249 RepID=A0A1R3V819_9HYPH|nr:hypothetical protein BQ8794_240247 [Mesorhizobium prunaredense]
MKGNGPPMDLLGRAWDRMITGLPGGKSHTARFEMACAWELSDRVIFLVGEGSLAKC